MLTENKVKKTKSREEKLEDLSKCGVARWLLPTIAFSLVLGVILFAVCAQKTYRFLNLRESFQMVLNSTEGSSAEVSRELLEREQFKPLFTQYGVRKDASAFLTILNRVRDNNVHGAIFTYERSHLVVSSDSKLFVLKSALSRLADKNTKWEGLKAKVKRNSKDELLLKLNKSERDLDKSLDRIERILTNLLYAAAGAELSPHMVKAYALAKGLKTSFQGEVDKVVEIAPFLGVFTSSNTWPELPL